MKKANCENADDDKAMSSDEGSQKDANSPAPLRDGNDGTYVDRYAYPCYLLAIGDLIKQLT